MTAPFKCPACDGFGKRARKEGGRKKRCRACDGECIVWQPAAVCLRAHYPPQSWWEYAPGWSSGAITSTTLDANVDLTGTHGTIYSTDTTGDWTGIKVS